jgi:hypothetical protein
VSAPKPLLNWAGSDLAWGRLFVRDMVLGWVTAPKWLAIGSRVAKLLFAVKLVERGCRKITLDDTAVASGYARQFAITGTGAGTGMALTRKWGQRIGLTCVALPLLQVSLLRRFVLSGLKKYASVLYRVYILQ